MPRDGIRSTYSQCPFQIRMHDDNGLISTGSAFYYVYNAEWFLITNWHNLSGKHFQTKQSLLCNNRLPTYIEANMASYICGIDGGAPGLFKLTSHRIDIYREEEPCWYEHPEFGSDCDVIALPFQRPPSCPEFMHNAANLIKLIKTPILPGNTVFVIGFPASLSVGFGLPIWKSGYIASEPFYNVKLDGNIADVGELSSGTGLPAFFIDAQTRPGMSGSPIFSRYAGTWDMSDPYKVLDPDSPEFWKSNNIALHEKSMEFIGCYSARVGKKEEQAALALCWRRDAIDAICASKTAAIHPHIS